MKNTITRAFVLAALPVALLLAGCEQRYPSKQEAINACVDWAEERGLSKGYPCQEEAETRQILGFDERVDPDAVAARFRW
jgi:hypothetical protein